MNRGVTTKKLVNPLEEAALRAPRPLDAQTEARLDAFFGPRYPTRFQQLMNEAVKDALRFAL